jgi:cyclopropane fatty-acyl-phospholipid synthase-like methyltransferase
MHVQEPTTTARSHADRVLDGGELKSDMTLADIGTAEGLVAFRAIDRVGPSLHVVLTDISATMLRHAERLASERGVRRQCTLTGRQIRTALVPPNAKEFDMAAANLTPVRATPGT